MYKFKNYTKIVFVISLFLIIYLFVSVYGSSTWDKWRPLIAGIKISTYGGGCVSYICDRWYIEGTVSASIGFKASWNGYIGFVTAGHFTIDSLDGEIYQPIILVTNYVGSVGYYELGDDIDFGFVIVDDGVVIKSRVYSERSITNYDMIVDKKYSTQIKMGDSVEKVGFVTGVTVGEVSGFITDLGTGKILFIKANYDSDRGDSGGFIGWFKIIYHPDYPADMYLYGIHVGVDRQDGLKVFVPIDRIEEFGVYAKFDG